MNKEIFKRTENKLYNYYKEKKMMYTLKDNIINLEKRLEEIKEDIKYINVSVDDYKSAGFNERVQTSLKAGSVFENQICAEIGKLEQEYTFMLRKILKAKRQLRESKNNIKNFNNKLEMLEEEEKKFLELKYSSKASMTAISRTLNIAEITAYRKREDILNKLEKAIAC